MFNSTSILYRVVDSVYRYKWRWIIPLSIITVCVLVLVVKRPKEYYATASIMVVNKAQVQNIMQEGNGYGYESPSVVNIRFFNNFLRDDAPDGFLDHVLSAAKLNPPVNLAKNPKDKRIEEVLKSLSTNSDNSEVFSISVKWKNRGEAERLAKAFQKVYIEARAEQKQAESYQTVVFLNKRIRFYENKLRDAEKAVSDFKSKYGSGLSDKISSQSDQLSILQTDLDTLNVTSDNNRLEREDLLKRLHKLKPQTVSDMTIASEQSPLAKQLEGAIEAREKYLSNGYRKDSTTVQRFDKTIERLRSDLEAERQQKAERARQGKPDGSVVETHVQENPAYADVEQRLFQVESEERINTSKRAKLQAMVAQYQTKLAELPDAERQLNERMRRFSALQKMYSDLVERKIKAENEIGLEKQIGLATLAKLGVVRAEPTSSKKKLLIIMIGACILGLVIGAVAVVVSEWLDPTLRYASDAQALLGVPVLASLPDARDLRIRLALPEPEVAGDDPPRLVAR